MSEVFSWPEGTVHLWTGTATASALLAYADNTRVSMTYGWESYRTLDANYRGRSTGQRADYAIGTLYTTDARTFQAIADAKTAVHIHFAHSASHGSAGHYLYSGVIDAVNYAGQNGQIYQFQIAGHAHVWSGY